MEGDKWTYKDEGESLAVLMNEKECGLLKSVYEQFNENLCEIVLVQSLVLLGSILLFQFCDRHNKICNSTSLETD